VFLNCLPLPIDSWRKQKYWYTAEISSALAFTTAKQLFSFKNLRSLPTESVGHSGMNCLGLLER
jgi:hypothetical protein